LESGFQSVFGDPAVDLHKDAPKWYPPLAPVRSLVKPFILAATAATLYELTKALAFPHQTLWQSHATTVVVISLAATVAFYAAACSRFEVLARTEWRAALNQRAEAERVNLAAAIEQASEAVMITNTEGVIQYVNPAFTRTTGYRGDEVMGQSARLLKSGNQEPAFYQNLWKTIVTGQAWRGELINRRKDGSLYREEMSITPVRDPRGEVTSFIAIKQDTTDRRRAEEAQCESEERFRTAFEEAPYGMCLTALDGRFLQANAALCEMLGYSRKELLEGAWQNLTHPDDMERSRRAMKQFMQESASSVELQKRYVHKNGTAIWFQLKISVVKNAHGAPAHFITHMEDITDRKRAEEALRASERRYRRFVERNWAGVLRNDLEGRILECNQSLVNLLGYTSAEELKTQRTQALYFTLSDRREMTRLLREQKALTNYEMRFRRKDGTPIWALANVTLVEANEEEGEVIEGTIVDITDRKRAEETLRASEARFRALVENSSDAILLLDHTGTVKYAASSTPRVLGYSEDELEGRNIFELMHPEFLEATRKSLAEALRRPDSKVEGECRYRHKDGSWRWYEFTGQNLLGNPAVQALVVNARDIDERKQVMAELQRATEAAEAANQAKSEFLANMSHEIRTPMNGVIGMTDLALDTNLDAEQREYLTTAKASAELLLDVINDILDFSKIEARKLSLERVPFSLKDTVDALTKVLAVRAAAKSLQLGSTFAPDLPAMVLGDPGRFRQILMNLIGNAIKFTEMGEVVVRVGKLSETPEQITLHISVEDTGIGIPKEKQRTIFEAFVQADASSTRQYGGTGLGLTITSQLVSMMGGKVWVESELGRGSTFHLTVCLGVVQTPADRPERAPLGAPPPPAEGRRSLRVLVVEDNPVNRLLGVRLVEKHGHAVVAVSSGQAAVEVLRRDRFDLVLMDVQMPGMDGFETTCAIRREETRSGKHLPIIAVTAHAMKGDRERCLLAGMDGYISKPINGSELCAAIENLVGDHRPAVTPSVL